MGLSSSISFSTSQVDPTSMLAVPARQPDPSADSSSDFDRHLDDANRSDDSAGARAADRRDEANQRDRASDAKKADSDTCSTDADTGNDTATDPVVVTAPAVTIQQAAAAGPVADANPAATGAKAAKAEKTAKVADVSTIDTAAQPAAAKADDAKAVAASAADLPVDAKPKTDGTTASRTDKPDEKADDTKTAAILPQAVVVPTAAAPVAAPKPKASTVDAVKQPAAAAPVLPTDAPLNAAALETAPETTGDQKAPTADPSVDPDAGLTIKASKEGLGHEVAAQMGDKNAARDAAQQTATQATAAPAAASAPTTFAAKTAAASGESGVQGISSTGATEGGSARLTDLQNVAGNQNQNSTTATVRIGTLPGQTQPTQVPAMTIALQIARNLQKGVNRFDIRLDPAEMGRIDVRMEVSRDGAVAAHLTVDRPETLTLLQRDAGSLQQALSDSGLQANPDSLSFSLRDQNAGGNAQGSSADGTGTSPLGAAASAEEKIMSPVYNVNLSATGGVDIRI